MILKKNPSHDDYKQHLRRLRKTTVVAAAKFQPYINEKPWNGHYYREVLNRTVKVAPGQDWNEAKEQAGIKDPVTPSDDDTRPLEPPEYIPYESKTKTLNTVKEIKANFPSLTEEEIRNAIENNHSWRYGTLPSVRDKSKWKDRGVEIYFTDMRDKQTEDYIYASIQKAWNELDLPFADVGVKRLDVGMTPEDAKTEGNFGGFWAATRKKICIYPHAHSEEKMIAVATKILQHEFAHAIYTKMGNESPENIKEWTDFTLTQKPFNDYVKTYWDKYQDSMKYLEERKSEYEEAVTNIDDVKNKISEHAKKSAPIYDEAHTIYKQQDELAHKVWNLERNRDNYTNMDYKRRGFRKFAETYEPENEVERTFIAESLKLLDVEKTLKKIKNKVVKLNDERNKLRQKQERYNDTIKYGQDRIKSADETVDRARDLYANEYHSALVEIESTGTTYTKNVQLDIYRKALRKKREIFGMMRLAPHMKQGLKSASSSNIHTLIKQAASAAGIDWDESKHPRDDEGKFSKSTSSSKRTPREQYHKLLGISKAEYDDMVVLDTGDDDTILHESRIPSARAPSRFNIPTHLKITYPRKNQSDFDVIVTAKAINDLIADNLIDFDRVSELRIGLTGNESDFYGAYWPAASPVMGINPSLLIDSDLEHSINKIKSTLVHEHGHKDWQHHPKYTKSKKEEYTNKIIKLSPVNAYTAQHKENMENAYLEASNTYNNSLRSYEKAANIIADVSPNQYKQVLAQFKEQKKLILSPDHQAKLLAPLDHQTKENIQRYNNLKQAVLGYQYIQKHGMNAYINNMMADIPKPEYDSTYQLYKDIYANETHSAIREIQRAGMTVHKGFNQKSYEAISKIGKEIFD